ncbi:MAG: phosphatase PAP2 family protein [Defluviitaleaceae bacterium]|nr:phosphatase PAP2 family protein [Defluviitaleaceae bacterium]
MTGYVNKFSAPFFFFVYIAGFIYCLIADKLQFMLYLAVPAGSLLCCLILRKAINRKRPSEANKAGSSFPSNHATSASAIALAFFCINTTIAIILLVLAVLTGVSRVVGKLHYTGDVLAGFAISALFYFIMMVVNKLAASTVIAGYLELICVLCKFTPG